ncbi:hypothetical protein KIH74_20655 [Kineosporia sp. J2-2]|uniref:Uncharacterized protein n=1 Tax=Kineosporia corallincola TaxID=2835133 RepID=A0ABS5TJS7_9ACTN|nr:hypothetical protein [Kineosporia corallincola]MBT0771361.1 hypothetical protein [Kineosporia corallincola]
MGLKIKTLKLPFVRISTSKAGRRSYAWRVGAWSYNSGTGRQSLKLSRNVRWESKTKAEKAKTRKAKDARSAERRAWEKKLAAGQVGGVNIPADVLARANQSGTARKPREQRANSAAPGARAGGRFGGGTVHRQTPQQIERAERARAQRQALEQERRDRAAQMTAALRADGTPEDRIPAIVALDWTAHQVAVLGRRKNTPPVNVPDAAAPAASSTGPDDTSVAPAAGGRMCGAPTQDGTPCRNAAGGCPHHKGNRTNSTTNRAARRPARPRTRRT